MEWGYVDVNGTRIFVQKERTINHEINDHRWDYNVFRSITIQRKHGKYPAGQVTTPLAMVVSLLFCTSYSCIIYHHAANWVYPYPICIRHYGRIDRTGNRVSISGNIISVTERTFVAVGGCGHDALGPMLVSLLYGKTVHQIW